MKDPNKPTEKDFGTPTARMMAELDFTLGDYGAQRAQAYKEHGDSVEYTVIAESLKKQAKFDILEAFATYIKAMKPESKPLLGIKLDEPSKSVVISRNQGYNQALSDMSAALLAGLEQTK